ncbi:MAG: hypothetical protein WCI73_04150 [Phycisphaerae bacterium]
MVTNLHTQQPMIAVAQAHESAPPEFAGALERLLAAAGLTSTKTIDISGLDLGDTFSDLARHKLAKRRKEVEDDDELDDDSEEEEEDDEDEDEDEDDDFDEDEEEFEEEFEDDELSDDDDDIFYDDDDDE